MVARGPNDHLPTYAANPCGSKGLGWLSVVQLLLPVGRGAQVNMPVT
jgi:hypothetical protein